MKNRPNDWLNEPGTTPLSFAFGALEDNPDGWSSPQTRARWLKHLACWWTELRQADAKALAMRQSVSLSSGMRPGKSPALTQARIFERASCGGSERSHVP